MLIDAKDRFIERMAQTIHDVKQDETLTGFADRFKGHTQEDIVAARVRSAYIDDNRLSPTK